MARYIDADVLKEIMCADCDNKHLCTETPACDTVREIYSMPTIEAEPVKHGRWVEDEDGFLICSECGNTAAYLILGQIETPYCSECGARMDGVEE